MEAEDQAAPGEPAPPGAGESTIDPRKIERFLDELRREQNLALGIAGGAIGAVLGAGAWAGVTAATNYQIGWMAVGVGFLTGFGVRLLGKGIDKAFGYAGAVLSLAGCLAGNVLMVSFFAAKDLGVSFGEVLSRLTPAMAIDMIRATFSPIDLLFYGIAVYEGYRFAFRRVTAEDLARLGS
jgi:hypothetical protein